jgi:hypothetical protein
MFYAMHVSNSNYYMHISSKIRGRKSNFSSYMKTGIIEYAQGSYNHEEEVIGLHVDMGNAETKSNGRRDRNGHVIIKMIMKGS